MQRRIAFFGAMALAVALCLASVSAAAQSLVHVTGEEQGWLCLIWVAPGEPFDVYVWLFPGAEGVLCVEYQLHVMPETATLISSFRNPWISTETGNPTGPPGVTVCFHECKRDPIWMYKLTYALADMRCTIFPIIAHEDTGVLRAMTCTEPHHPFIQFDEYMFPGVMCPCPAVESSSWGAIKTLLME